MPIFVCCALIIENGKIACTQRGSTMRMPGLWEFPGGKRHENETLEDCIIREIHEELGIDIEVLGAFAPINYLYPDGLHIELSPFVCRRTAGEFFLHEHAALLWLTAAELNTLKWSAADAEVIKLYLHSFDPKNYTGV